MIIIYILILIFLLSFFLATKKYKKEMLRDINKKEHSLSFIYCSAFFLIDIFSKLKCILKPANDLGSNTSLNTRLSQLYAGKDIKLMRYLILSKRICTALLTLFCFISFGLIYSISSPDTNAPISELERPTNGSISNDYQLIIDNGETKEEIDISISKKLYEYSEALSIFDKYRDEIVTELLNSNSSTENVSSSLNFYTSIGAENIQLSWAPEDSSLIDFNGNLIYENISNDGTSTCVYATLSLDDCTASMMIGLTLFPSKDILSAKYEIEKYINEYSDPYSQDVELPETLSSFGNVTYSLPSTSTPILFLAFGIIASVIMYYARSKEISILLKKREIQMIDDYPEIVSKLLLLHSAGMTIRAAFTKIAEDYHKRNPDKPHYAYEELRYTLNALSNGVSETLAYSEFGKRCGLRPYLKLGTLLEQNLNKGSKDLRFLLNHEVHSAFESKKARALILGEEAGTKLLFPMVLILVVVMIIIIVPSFISISF